MLQQLQGYMEQNPLFAGTIQRWLQQAAPAGSTGDSPLQPVMHLSAQPASSNVEVWGANLLSMVGLAAANRMEAGGRRREEQRVEESSRGFQKVQGSSLEKIRRVLDAGAEAGQEGNSMSVRRHELGAGAAGAGGAKAKRNPSQREGGDTVGKTCKKRTKGGEWGGGASAWRVDDPLPLEQAGEGVAVAA